MPWGAIWQVQAEQVQLKCLEQLIHKGREEASALPPLTEGHIWYTIRQMALKARGLDGIGFDFLKALPFVAMSDLKELFHHIEEQVMIPSQWGTSLIALLPSHREA